MSNTVLVLLVGTAAAICFFLYILFVDLREARKTLCALRREHEWGNMVENPQSIWGWLIYNLNFGTNYNRKDPSRTKISARFIGGSRAEIQTIERKACLFAAKSGLKTLRSMDGSARYIDIPTLRGNLCRANVKPMDIGSSEEELLRLEGEQLLEDGYEIEAAEKFEEARLAKESEIARNK